MIFKFKNMTYSTDIRTYKTLSAMIIKAGVNKAREIIEFALSKGWIQKLSVIVGLDIVSTTSFVSGGRVRTAYRYRRPGAVICSTLIV